ncbi:MAG: hypothetical protein J0H99_24595, partial [Rhodospirillales bacterium]|nr:hypothetical protein [Rhodospirillales bacterium]
PSNEPTFSRLIKAGALAEIDRAKVPNWKNLDPDLMRRVESSDPGNRHGSIYLWGTIGLGVLPDKVRAVAPDAPMDSWALLFDPANAMRIAACGITMMDSAIDVIPSVLAWLGKDPNSTDAGDLAQVEKMLMAIRPYIRTFASGGALEAMANGETCLVFDYSGDVIQASWMRLLKTLENLRPESMRDFFNLAAVHVRRELLDLARRALAGRGFRDNCMITFGAPEFLENGALRANAEDLCLALIRDVSKSRFEFEYAMPPGGDGSHVSAVAGYHGGGGDTHMAAILLQTVGSNAALSLWNQDGLSWTMLATPTIAGLPLSGRIAVAAAGEKVTIAVNGREVVSTTARQLGIPRCDEGLGVRWIGADIMFEASSPSAGL